MGVPYLLISLLASDSIALRNSSAGKRQSGVTTSTTTTGNAGSITLTAPMVGIGDSFIESEARAGSRGRAGNITVVASDVLNLSKGASITSSTYSNGSAGDITITSSGTLALLDGAVISSNTHDAGHAGTIRISAANARISGEQTAISSQAQAGSSGSAGNITVSSSETLSVSDHGRITSSTIGAGNAGGISIDANDIALDSQALITSQAAERSTGGHAGPVVVNARRLLSVSGQANIDSSTFADGNAGSVSVSARDIVVDGALSGISSSAISPGHGNAGSVNVFASGDLTLRNGGVIDSSTWSAGDAGSIRISANRVNIRDRALISSFSYGETLGSAGEIRIDAKDSLRVTEYGSIVSSTFTAGNAGSIHINAGDALVDSAVIMSQAQEGSSGLGGVVQIDAGRLSMKNQGIVTSSTLGRGNAGVVSVTAQDIDIDNAFIASASTDTSSGNAGGVMVRAPSTLSVSNGGVISSSTHSRQGAGGIVLVIAGDILLTGVNGNVASGIKAEAGANSSGRTGEIAIAAAHSLTLTDGALISVRNTSTAKPGGLPANDLTISAPTLTLSGLAQITSESTNALAADNVFLAVSNQLKLTDSAISTRANNGDGGNISIGSGTRIVHLRNSAISTSVVGNSGNGGDIGVRSDVLILDTGLIQANTAAANASGGKVQINVASLLPSGSSLLVGGDTPYPFQRNVFGANVIQAAAPSGLSGDIRISSPLADVSGSLADLNVPALDLGVFGRDHCQRGAGSTLTIHARGALPPGPQGFVRPDTAEEARAGRVDASERSARNAPCR